MGGGSGIGDRPWEGPEAARAPSPPAALTPAGRWLWQAGLGIPTADSRSQEVSQLEASGK